jgi:hypothetical protein
MPDDLSTVVEPAALPNETRTGLPRSERDKKAILSPGAYSVKNATMAL